MASLVNHHLALENQVEMVGLLVLNDADLYWLTIVLVIKILGPKCRRPFLVLK